MISRPSDISEKEFITYGNILFKILLLSNKEGKKYLISLLNYAEDENIEKLMKLKTIDLQVTFVMREMELLNDPIMYKVIKFLISALLYSNNLELREEIWLWLINSCVS